MNNELQAYLADGGPVGEGDYAGLQRLALQDVLRLSSEQVGPIESLIESAYQTAKKDLQGQFEADKRAIDVNFRPQLDEARQRYEAQVQAIGADYDRQRRALDAQTEQRRQEAVRQAVERQRQAAQQRQDQVMEAEFLVEGTLEKAKQRRKQVQAAAQVARRRLEGLRREADERLRLYHQPIPAWDDGLGPVVAPDARPGKVQRMQEALAQQHLDTLRHLAVGYLVAGARPAIILAGAVAGVLGAMALVYSLGIPGLPSFWVAGPVAVAVTLAALAVAGWVLWKRSGRQALDTYGAFQQALAQAAAALEQQHRLTQQRMELRFGALIDQGKAEIRRARQAFEAAEAQISQQRQAAQAAIDQNCKQMHDHLVQHRDKALREAQQQYQQDRSQCDRLVQEEMTDAQQRHDQTSAGTEGEHGRDRLLVHERWDKGLTRIEALLKATSELDPRTVGEWEAVLRDRWEAPSQTPAVVRFGTWKVDLHRLAEPVLSYAGPRSKAYGPVVLPAVLALPGRGSLLLQHQREGRAEAIEALRAVMVRLFTSLPPGRVHFTLVDPIGLGQSFAGFMHAGDYRESLVGGRIWTEVVEIQQQLEDLTNHMEDVIQKYLRNEFETIEQYNRQAGPLAEPYRFLVMADFPAHVNEESARRLASIVHSGPRCGVHTLIAYDSRQEIPAGIDLKDLAAAGAYLMYETPSQSAGRFVWQDSTLQHFPLVLDGPPSEKALTRIMHAVGKASVDAARVEVPFEGIAPAQSQVWSLDSRQELKVPIGHTGATRWQVLNLGRGVAQHVLIAGKTGSGKSTLLHVIVTNLALWYGPDQVELYLIDFKKGVEFKTYVTHRLPHARAVAIESDREFGLSILQRLGAEMTRRGELFRQAGVQDIAAYRDATGPKGAPAMPRIVLIVDEFQVFFGEDDKLAQDAAMGLEQLVRQGRAFGMHVILGSQTLGGAFGLARSTMGQMAVRIALQCSEADSQLILDDENVAARRLARPGEAIYNDAGGRVVGNSPFQTAWLSEAVRDRYLSGVRARAGQAPEALGEMVVFEGNAPADIADNPALAACLQQDGSLPEGQSARVWLGSPVAIKGPTEAVLRRQSGANLLLVGQREDLAMDLMAGALISLAAQARHAPGQFVILDGSPADSPPSQLLQAVTSVLGRACRQVALREVPEVIAELAREVERRVQDGGAKAPGLYVLLYAMQRYGVLRRSEDAFGLSLNEPAQVTPSAGFAELLRTGPGVGVHVLAWADTLATVERTIDRQTLREFDYRVLFQMSAADSSNLMDSPAANQLGFHRAILYSQEQGALERFRPYAVIREQWLAEVATRLAARNG